MGWRERDYARWTPEERRRFLSTGTRSRGSTVGTSRRFGATQGAGVAVAVSALLFCLGHFPSGHPIVPALHLSLPARTATPARVPILGLPPARVHLRGPKAVRVGSFLTFHGPVPTGDNGRVVIEGSLNGAAWRTFAVADGSSGNYLARIGLDQRGTLRLRVIFRDGAEGVQTITVR